MTPGTQLGSYEILSPPGKGGMGEVWRARDSKLGREVAIKTLPEEFAKDEERLARFEREAKSTPSCNRLAAPWFVFLVSTGWTCAAHVSMLEACHG